MALLKRDHKTYYAREGLIAVGLSWLTVSLFGAALFPQRRHTELRRLFFRGGIGLHHHRCERSDNVETLPRGLSTGAVLPTGSAEWAFWCFCWPSRRLPGRPANRCICCARRAPRQRRQACAPDAPQRPHTLRDIHCDDAPTDHTSASRQNAAVRRRNRRLMVPPAPAGLP